jgi:hypothetical protein
MSLEVEHDSLSGQAPGMNTAQKICQLAVHYQFIYFDGLRATSAATSNFAGRHHCILSPCSLKNDACASE